MPPSILQLRPTDYEDYVEVLVDGEKLAERLMAAERASGATYINEDDGIFWIEVDRSWGTAFDQTVMQSGTYHGPMIFICGCGEPACGHTSVTVTTTETTIAFSEFRHGSQPALAVAPVTFNRDQFTQEVNRINTWYAATHPEAAARKPIDRARMQELRAQYPARSD